MTKKKLHIQREVKSKHKKDLVKAKRIIFPPLDVTCIILVDSQGYVQYEGNNINKKMILRTQLKDVKMKMSERIHSCFTKIS